MKKFFDCGTHLFGGFDYFSRMYNIDSTWQCYCFEANPVTYKLSKNKLDELIKNGFKIEHFNNAVNNVDGEIKVNCALENGTYSNVASNVLENPPLRDKWYGTIFEYTSEEHYVKSINFSEFLKNNISEGDFVVVKMDIEGSEFPVLDSLIETGVFKIVNDMYVEFHERFFDDMNLYVNKKNEYKRIFAENNVKLSDWI